MHVRRAVIWTLRGVALSAVVAILLAAGRTGALAVPRSEMEEVERMGEPRSAPDSFRVQLYATTRREAAESFRSKVRRWWVGEQVPSGVFEDNPSLTIEHAEPYYRVHAGAFSERSQAGRAQSFLSQQYPDAFVTRIEAGQGAESSGNQSTEQGPPAEQGNPERNPRTSQRGRIESDRRDSSNDAGPAPPAAWNRIRKATRLVDRSSRDTVYTQASLAELFEVGCAPPVPEQARANALARESSHFSQNLGLEVEARYGQRTSAIADETAGSLSGTYVGLEWDLLSQGLIGNRRRSDLLGARGKAEQLTGKLAQIQRTETCRARRIQERLRGMVPRLLEAKIELAKFRQRLLRRAYLEGGALLNTFLKAKENVSEAERRLKTLREKVHAENEPAPLDAFPPLLNFDFQALAQANRGDSLRRELGEVERQIVALEEETTFDTRLSVFSRYTTTRTFGNRDLEFGVRFSQPLSGVLFGSDRHAEGKRAELRRREQKLALSERRANLRSVRRRFEENQARAVRAHYRVASRRERVRRRLSQQEVRGNAQLIEGLRDAESMIGALVEKALAYGEVYEGVARAFSAAREPFDPVYLSTQSMTNYEQRARTGQRALYIWSEELQRRSNAFIIELAQARKIERLIVSAGQNTPMEKVRALQAKARKNDIATELLLASNHWVRPGGVDRAQTRIGNLDLQESALHLDVEPHMYDDFDQKKDEYLRRYLEVLHGARRTVGDSTELVVSVPLFWPDRIYQEIVKIVDRVHFMAYGEKKIRQRANQTLEVARHFSPEQRVVAVRPEDFADPLALDQAISTLQEVAKTDRFALHDLKSFLQFIEDEP